MAIVVKALKFVNGVAQPISTEIESLVAKSFVVGGLAGTELTKAILDTLIGGTGSDASSLHQHDSRYYRKDEFINSSSGVPDSQKPIKTNASGQVDPSFINQSAISHGNLSGLSADDHLQYHNDARGDARYYQKTEFRAVSAGVSDADKPVKLDAGGKIDASMIDSSDTNHEGLSGLQGGTSNEHYHLTQSQHGTLTGGTSSDASSLHNHDTRYYTKTEADADLALKANTADVIKHDGSVPFSGHQSMGGFRLTNLGAPTVGSDAANRTYVDTQDALKVNKSGDTMSGTLNMNNNPVTNLPDPVNPGDAANKQYVDAARQGLTIKDPVRVASTANIDLLTGGLLTVDGIGLVAGDRVLVKNQTVSAENGIYVASSGAWVRSDDANTSAEVKAGMSIWVNEGTAQGDSQWVLTTDDPITLGTTSLTFTKMSGAAAITAGVGLSKAGDTLDVNLGSGIHELPSDEIGIDIYAAGGLDLVDPGTGLPSGASNAQLALKLDGTTLEKTSTGVKVKDAGITATQLATSVAGAGLSGGAGTPLAVNTGDGVEILSDAVKVKVSDFAGEGLEDDGVNNLRLKASVAGDGLSHAAGILSVNTDDVTIEKSADALRVKDGGITAPKIAALAVKASKIDFGTGADQVSAADIPLEDAADKFSATEIEGALGELANAAYVESFTAGEAIGQDDLCTLRRDSSGNPKIYKACAAAADNYVAAVKVIQDLTYAARVPSGNHISIRYLDPAIVNASLTVSVIGGSLISVSLATDGAGAITSTAAQIKSAIEAHVAANDLVAITISGSGSQIQTAQAETFLANGMDYNDNGRWEVIGKALAAAASGVSIRVKKIGRLNCPFVVAPTTQEIGKTVYLSINRGQAQLSAPSAVDTGIVALGRLVSLTEVEFRAPILRGVNG